nr:hypothetical protein [Stutzerimonas nitrititolerans]
MSEKSAAGHAAALFRFHRLAAKVLVDEVLPTEKDSRNEASSMARSFIEWPGASMWVGCLSTDSTPVRSICGLCLITCQKAQQSRPAVRWVVDKTLSVKDTYRKFEELF